MSVQAQALERGFPKVNFDTSLSDYEKKPNIIQEKRGNVINVRANNDFVSGISYHYEMDIQTKPELYKTLEKLIADPSNTAKLAEAFRQVEQNKLLKRQDKIKWIKERVNDLPAPFTLLLASLVAEDDIQQALFWRILASMRMGIDVTKCKDGSATQARLLVEAYYMDDIFDTMVSQIDKKSKNRLNGEQLMEMWNKLQQSVIPVAIAYHQKNPYTVEYPYWAAHHGLAYLTALKVDGKEMDDTKMFHPKKDHAFIEKQVVSSFSNLYRR